MAMLRAVVGAVAWLSGAVKTGRNTGRQRWLCSVVRHRVTMCQSPAGTGKGLAFRGSDPVLLQCLQAYSWGRSLALTGLSWSPGRAGALLSIAIENHLQ